MKKTTAPRAGAGGAAPPTKESAHKPKNDKGRRESSHRDCAADNVLQPSAFGPVHRRAPDFYSVPAFRRLPVDAQRAAVLLWTHGDTPLHGIVLDASLKVSGRLSVSPGKARSMLAALMQAGFICVCDEADLVWLFGFIEGQLGASPARTAEWTANTVRSINRLPQTRLVDAYRTHYKLPLDAPKATGKTAKKQRVSEGVSAPPPRGSPGSHGGDVLSVSYPLGGGVGCSRPTDADPGPDPRAATPPGWLAASAKATGGRDA